MHMPRRFQTLSGMFLTLLAAVLAGLFLEAEGLKIWAERLEVGPLRSVAQPLTEAWRALVGGSGVEAPRKAALVLKADWAGSFASSGTRADTVTPSAPPVLDGAPSLSQSGIASPMAAPQAGQSLPAVAAMRDLPSTTPSVAGVPPSAPQVVLAGDSMMAVGLAPVLRRGLGVNVIKAYRSGTGLARPEVFDWLEQYPLMLGESHPALVICALGANDGQNIQVGKAVLVFGSAEWDVFYRARLTAYLDLLTQDGRKVLWVGMPLMRSQSFARKMKHMNALVQDVLRRYPQVSWLDPNPVLGYDDAVFAQYRPDARGRMIKLRADDGIHMTDEGAAFLLPEIRGWLSQRLSRPDSTASVASVLVARRGPQ